MLPQTSEAAEILLRFLLDKQSVQDVTKGAKTIGEAIDGTGVSVKTFNDTSKELGVQLDIQSQKMNQLQGDWRKTQRVAMAADYTFRTILVTGTALAGSLALLATSYVDTMNKAGVTGDQTVNRWNAATKDLDADKTAIGKIATEALLPALETATRLANQATAFAQANPQIIQAALGAGAALITLGAIGVAVTTGFKLYTDAKFALASLQNLTAAEMMIKASENMLAAATESGLIQDESGAWRSVTTGRFAPAPDLTAGAGGGGILASIGSAAAFIIPIALTAVAAYFVGNAINKATGQKETSVGDLAHEAQQVSAIVNPLNLLSMALHSVGLMSDDARDKIWQFVKWINGLGDATQEAGVQIENTAKQLADAQALKDGMKVIASLEKDLAKMAEQEAADEVRIKETADKEMITAANNYADSIARAAVNLAAKLASLATQYSQSEANATADYQRNIAHIIRDAHIKAEREEQRYQDELFKLKRDHDDNVYNLALSRDALGLVQEQRQYKEKLDDAKKQHDETVAQDKQDLKIRLADAKEAFEAEEAQRLQNYLDQQAQAKAEYDKQLADAKTAELVRQKEIKDNEARDLAQLKIDFANKRNAAIQAAWDQLHDLDGALRDERDLKSAYYAAMRGDMQTFINDLLAMAAGLHVDTGSGGGGGGGHGPIPRLAGGYVFSGSVFSGAEDGRPEFMMNAPTTRAAERVVGGQLNQSRVMQVLNGRSSEINITIQGQGISIQQVKHIVKANVEELSSAIFTAMESA